MKNEIIKKREVNSLYINIKELIKESRNKIYKTVNVERAFNLSIFFKAKSPSSL